MKIDYSETVVRETVYEFNPSADQRREIILAACKAAAGLSDRDDLIVEWDAIEEYNVRIIAPHASDSAPDAVEAVTDAQVGISWADVTVKEDAASTGEIQHCCDAPVSVGALRSRPDHVAKSRPVAVKAEVKIIADHIRSLDSGFSARRSHDIAACLLNGRKATEVAAEMGETQEAITAHFRAMIHKSIKAADGNISIEGRKVLMNALSHLVSEEAQ